MKAERRHELKTNALATKLESAPAFFQQYGTRILLGIVFALLIYILIQNHYTDKAHKAETAAKNLGAALYAVNQLRSIPGRVSQEQIAALRKEYAHDAENAITDVLSDSDDPRIRAEAFVVRGDLNWELANLPELPAAATQPVLKLEKTSDAFLTEAAGAYNEVLSPPLNSDEVSLTAARISLGKIAENRSQWAEAKKYYQQVVDDSSAASEFKARAQEYIDALAGLEKPTYAGGEDDASSPLILKKPETFGPFAPQNLATAPTTAAVYGSGPATTTPATSPATQATTLMPSKGAATTVPMFVVPASNPATQPLKP